jgi:glutamate-1-semialdehyde 2,1-aminomutase
VLIFDEMVTLSAGLSGAQGIYGILPELTTCGKAIGGGFPIGGIGGVNDVMAHLDPRQPEVPVTSIFGASFGGHPFALAAGLAQMQRLTADVFAHMDALADRLRQGVSEIAADLAIPLSATGVGRFSMLHWNGSPVVTHADHARCDHAKLATICGQLRTSGFVGSGERFQTSFPMTAADIDDFLTTLSRICKSL